MFKKGDLVVSRGEFRGFSGIEVPSAYCQTGFSAETGSFIFIKDFPSPSCISDREKEIFGRSFVFVPSLSKFAVCYTRSLSKLEKNK